MDFLSLTTLILRTGSSEETHGGPLMNEAWYFVCMARSSATLRVYVIPHSLHEVDAGATFKVPWIFFTMASSLPVVEVDVFETSR